VHDLDAYADQCRAGQQSPPRLCGDAHLSNFGAFGSPERRVVFDLNDFDETLPGPFEWDVKRLVASMVVAGRENGFGAKDRRAVGNAAVSAYREAMLEFARTSILEVWYARFDVEEAIARFKAQLPKPALRRSASQLAKIRTRDSMQALAKLTTVVDGRPRIVSDPPLIVPVEELAGEVDVDEVYAFLRSVLADYLATLSTDRRHLLDRYSLTRMARKVVGVGSVGTQSWILLMEPEDGFAPLVLQAKQAQQSVLADYAGRSEYDNQGERVVTGQRLMQAASDIFLGWDRVTRPDGTHTPTCTCRRSGGVCRGFGCETPGYRPPRRARGHPERSAATVAGPLTVSSKGRGGPSRRRPTSGSGRRAWNGSSG
jgi:uncharacterized protein (DUF2252 family)